MGGSPLPVLSRELVVVRRRGHSGSQAGEVDREATKYLPRRALDVEQAQEEMFIPTCSSGRWSESLDARSRARLARLCSPVECTPGR